MNKKLLVICTTAALPFILVWCAFLLTAMSFNPREIFLSDSFWGPSVIYWIIWVCTIGLQVELVNEIYNKEPAK